MNARGTSFPRRVKTPSRRQSHLPTTNWSLPRAVKRGPRERATGRAGSEYARDLNGVNDCHSRSDKSSDRNSRDYLNENTSISLRFLSAVSFV